MLENSSFQFERSLLSLYSWDLNNFIQRVFGIDFLNTYLWMLATFGTLKSAKRERNKLKKKNKYTLHWKLSSYWIVSSASAQWPLYQIEIYRELKGSMCWNALEKVSSLCQHSAKHKYTASVLPLWIIFSLSLSLTQVFNKNKWKSLNRQKQKNKNK